MPSRAVAGGMDRKAESPSSGSMGDDDNAARRPSGGRAAGWMTYATRPNTGQPPGLAGLGGRPPGTPRWPTARFLRHRAGALAVAVLAVTAVQAAGCSAG